MNQEELRKEAAEKYAGEEYQSLFDHMSQEHGLTLLQSEMDEIRNICRNMDKGAELEAERGRWMPIETAPKDGTKITVAIIDGNENHYYPTTASYRCYHQNSKGKEMFRDRNGIKLEKLTHWMPITPPKTSKQ